MALDWLVLLTFVPASLALNVTPGADMMFCVGQGVRSGAGAAWKGSAGVAVGGLIHALVAGLGVGAIVAAHPVAFDAIRWVGAAYLLWMAWQILRSKARPGGAEASAGRPFRDGLLVNLSNPKVILFILAFVPQFVDPTQPVLPQFLIFGAVLSLGGLIINGVVGALAGRLQQRFVRGARGTRWMQRISAAIFAGLALRLILLQRS
ncbi:LysE family translocator [Pseudooceanicola sediminis]|uniref:LysE family translocator n=1 Tax=Pseudooceanicola sediminis TaxID=2211117 RepID=A0A399J236_9RHOB|nr:LysE family translocator [Pseudooceanicola sediminis]KAA2314586.1 LysE family translocator [Puniceibacterium sp. HSS470]RII39458.1 LysE family translocator [Pseudooceanicola sediminis]|tara:strand:- start:5859 stop:6476 length:618 start_codon:yes stop_codon:yes gene_type:complete